MPTNEFEQQVQQKMDELQLRPAGEVWEEVERRIRKDKRRRWLILWWLLPLLLAVGAGWMLWGLSDKKQVAENKTINKTAEIEKKSTNINKEAIISKAEIKNDSVEPEIKTTADKKDQIVPVDKLVIMKYKENGNDNAPLINVTALQNKKKKTRDIVVQAKGRNNPVLAIGTDEEVVNVSKASTNMKPVLANNSLQTHQPIIDTDLLSVVPAQKKESGVPVQTLIASKDTAITAITKNEKLVNDTGIATAIQPKDHKAAKKKNRVWGLQVQGGSSNTSDSKRLFAASSSYADALSYSFGVPASGVSGNTAPNTIIYQTKPAMSWSAGLFVRQNISKRFTLSGGIGYSLLQTTVRVGAANNRQQVLNNYFSSNRSINNYYALPVTGANHRYVNKYHFAVISTELGWQFNKSKEKPMSIDLGLTCQRLLFTNSLLYDYKIPGFYKDRTAFNKNHFFISAGLNFTVLNKKKANLELNPFAEASLSTVYPKRDSANLRYNNLGIRLRLIFKK